MEAEYIEISNRSTVALVRKVRTGHGVRLEVYSPETDQRIHLDPIILESLTWQTTETFSETLEASHEAIDTGEEVEERRVAASEEYTEFSNEFAFTLVRKVRVGNEERLEILSPKLGYQIYLGAPLLESLTSQPPQTLSRFLEEPYGPQGATH